MQTVNNKLPKARQSHAEWVQQRDRARILWVITSLAFWISLAILVVFFLLQDALSLVLTSIVLGMLILGVWLKARYQLMLRKEPDNMDNGEDHQPGL